MTRLGVKYEGGIQNAVYWAIYQQLDYAEVRVLGDVAGGHQPNHERDRFWIAHLIALDCLEWDSDAGVISITTKGRDGLAFHRSTC